MPAIADLIRLLDDPNDDAFDRAFGEPEPLDLDENRRPTLCDCPYWFRRHVVEVHEPNLLDLTAGANVVYTETEANPRDTEADTSSNRGLDMVAARKMLYEAGFTSLRLGGGRTISLDLPYLVHSTADGNPT